MSPPADSSATVAGVQLSLCGAAERVLQELPDGTFRYRDERREEPAGPQPPDAPPPPAAPDGATAELVLFA